MCYLILKDLPADWLQKGGEPEAVDRRFSRAKSSARRVTEDAWSHEQNICEVLSQICVSDCKAVRWRPGLQEQLKQKSNWLASGKRFHSYGVTNKVQGVITTWSPWGLWDMQSAMRNVHILHALESSLWYPLVNKHKYWTWWFSIVMSVYQRVNVNITNWKIPPFFVGKLTISTGPFSIAFCQITRG